MDKRLSVRIPEELYVRIEFFCKKKKIESISDFVKAALVKYITPDVEDELLVFESLKDVHSRLHLVMQQQDIFFNFFCFFIKHFFVYNAEVPEEHKGAAAASALQRFDEMMSDFQKGLNKNNNSMFESLLADFFEIDK